MKNAYIRRIEEIRDEYGYKNEKMARLCGMEPKYLRKMIKTDTYPKLETIEKICSGMNISLRQFYTSSVFETNTETQEKLEAIFVSLDPDNKLFLMKIAEELKELQDRKMDE